MRDPRQKVPDRLTLVDHSQDFTSLTVEEGEDCHLVLTFHHTANISTIHLKEDQVKRLQARIGKFFRDIR